MTIAGIRLARLDAFDAALLSVSGIAWIVFLAMRHDGHGHTVASNAVMVVAMMAIGIAGPFRHLCTRCLSRDRALAISLFTLGYVSIWLGACDALIALASLLRVAVGNAASTLVALVLALGWQISHPRAWVRRRCHLRPAVPIFGWRAFAVPWSFGMRHGVTCVGLCAPIMLLTFSSLQHHEILMAMATAVVIVENSSGN